MAKLGTGFAIGRAGTMCEEGLAAAAAAAGACNAAGIAPALRFGKFAGAGLLVSLVLL